MPSHRRRFVTALSALCILVTTSAAPLNQRPQPESQRSLILPAAVVHSATESDLDARRLQLAAPDPRLAALRAEAGGGAWDVQLERPFGPLRRALGAGITLLPTLGDSLRPASPANLPSLDEAATAARAFLTRHLDLLGGVDLSEWELAADASQPLDGGRIWPLRFVRRVDGIAVVNAQIQLVLNRGKLVYINATGLDFIALPTAPTLTDDAAWRRVEAYAASRMAALVGSSLERGAGGLELVPSRVAPGAATSYRLVHWVEFTATGEDGGELRAQVDAVSGEVVAVEDRILYACDLDAAELQGRIRGGVRPAQASDPEEVRHFPFPTLTEAGKLTVADGNGYFPYGGAAADSTLGGGFFDVECMQNYDTGALCAAQPGAATNAGDGIIDFGVGGSDHLQDPSGASTPADRTSFYHLNAARAMAAKWIARPWLASPVDVRVNINFAFGATATCNAFWNGSSFNFFRSGGGCANTGEIRDVMQHEWGHGLDQNDGLSPVDRAFGEAFGDHIALFIDHDSCIGQSFWTGNSGPFCGTNPSCVPLNPSCTGVRNIDEKRTTRGLITIANLNSKCGTGPCLGVLGRECHCEGEIYGQAAFHLARNLLEGRAYDTGTQLAGANPAYSDTAAWFVHERLFFNATAIMSSYAPSNRQSVGTSAYDAYMVVDDDDGNLANGTPNAAYIHQAFAHHGMNEPTAVADSANCAAPADPAITVSTRLDAVTGQAQVAIGWTDTGASFYLVYRNLSRSDAWLPIRDQVVGGSPDYAIYDEPVQIGETYNYAVVAVSANGCPSAGLDIETLTVGLPDAGIAVTAATDAAPGGDGDGRLEPGERIRLTLALSEEVGLVGLSNASVVVTTSDPLATVTVPGPIAYGTIAAGGTRNGPSPFEVAVSVAHGCGSDVPLIAEVSSDDGCLLRSVAFTLAGGGCVVRPRGEAAATAIMVVDDTLSPACSDGDGTIDDDEIVRVEVTVANGGTALANNITVDLASFDPELRVLMPASIAIASLAPGGSTTAPFTVQARGGTCQQSVDLVATVNSDDNIAPFTRAETFALESDESTVPLATGFESGLDGWAAVGFVRSTARASAGSWSAYAGPGVGHDCDSSTDGSGDCSSLTSPDFVVGPGSVFTLDTRYSLEAFSSGQYWDRVNVHLVDLATGAHTLLVPTSGRAYDGGTGHSTTLCHVDAEAGWAGIDGTSWASSTFNLASFAGRAARIEVNYNADDVYICDGIFVDQLTITDARAFSCDALTCASCGNGSVEGAEACDDGAESAACNADCTLALCGDGKRNLTAGEACDDGSESATCNADCSLATCGDGKRNATAGEACDDGGESASCNGDCSPALCGDGKRNAAAGEACDDAGESASCNVDCSPATCGDGKRNAAAGEACDDGGESASCNVDCSPALCGDGKRNAAAGEACDDAGESAACDGDCSPVACGDRLLNPTAGEECDDGNPDPGDGCGSDCKLECVTASLGRVGGLRLVTNGSGGIVISWSASGDASSYHVNAMAAKGSLIDPTRAGGAVSVCDVTAPAAECVDADGMTDPAAVVYQVLGACGAAAEGPW